MSPNVDQLCCDRAECRKEFNTNQIEVWKLNQEEQNGNL